MKKTYLATLIILALLTLLSLALNGVVILGLVQARTIAMGAIREARTALTEIGDSTFTYTLEIDQEIPVQTTVPIHQEVVVPIQTTLPISTIVNVPVNAGILGEFDVDVPVRTIIPVDLEVTIPVNETVEIATSVPLNVDIPIAIPLADTPIYDYLAEVDGALEATERRLANPLRKP